MKNAKRTSGTKKSSSKTRKKSQSPSPAGKFELAFSGGHSKSRKFNPSKSELKTLKRLLKFRYFSDSTIGEACAAEGIEDSSSFKRALEKQGLLLPETNPPGTFYLHWEETQKLLDAGSVWGRLFRRQEQKGDDAAHGSFVARMHPAIRWLAFLPLSFTAAGLILIFWRGLARAGIERQLGAPIEESSAFPGLIPLAFDAGEMFLATVAFVAVAAYVAPKFQMPIAIIQVVIATIVVTMLLTLGLVLGAPVEGWRLLASFLGALAGGGAGIYGVRMQIVESRIADRSIKSW